MDTLTCKKILLFSGLLFLQACTNAVPKLSGLNINFSSSNSTTVEVLSVNANPTSGSFVYGEDITIQVTFSDSVSVASGIPTLKLAIGSRTASYVSGSGSNTLTFKYTVGLGDSSSDLQYADTSSLILNGSTLTGPSSKTVNVTLPALESNNSLASTSNIIVNGTPIYFSISNLTFDSTITTFTRKQSLVVQNTSANSISISGITFSNTSLFNFTGGSFPGAGGTCAAALAASSTCTLNISFTPLATGSYNTSFTINFTDGGVSLQNIFSVTGTAITNFTLATNDLTDKYTGSSIWNRYVKSDGTTCTTSDTQCVHAAEHKVVQVPALSGSCSSLIASDSLGAFTWICDDSSAVSNGTIYFKTSSLATGKGLRDLISSSGSWKPITVNVHIVGGSRNGELFATRPNSANWWTNTITPLPANASLSLATLSTANTIYYSSTDVNVNGGYRINADGISILTLNGAKIIQTGTTADTTADCYGATISNDTRSMICAYQKKNLWIEADMDGKFDASAHIPSLANAAAVGVKFNDVTFSRIHMSKFENFGTNSISYSLPAIRLVNSSKNRLTKVYVHNAYGGIHLVGENGSTSDYNILKDIRLSKISALSYATKALGLNRANNNKAFDVQISGVFSHSNDATGLLIENGSSTNSIQKIMVSNVSGNVISGSSTTNAYGIRIYDSGSTQSNNILSQPTVFAVNGMGLLVESTTGVSNTYISHATISNNKTFGLYLTGPSNTNALLNNIVSLNNEQNIAVYSAAAGSSANFYNVVSTNASLGSGNGAVYLDGYYSVTFNNYLITDPSGANKCYKGASVSSNLSSSTCSIGGGSYQESVALEAAQSFVGKVTKLTSPSDVNPRFPSLPVVYFSTLVSFSEWMDFSNLFRGWGSDGSFGTNFPDNTQQGSCDTNTESNLSYFCNIWDWRIRQNSPLNNKNITYFTTNTTETFANGNCTTAQLNGSNTLSINGMNFMRYAVEIDSDNVGNDNGLCEDNENCIYAPNSGSFQGQNSLSSQYCSTSTGLVTGAKIYKYSSLFAPTPY